MENLFDYACAFVLGLVVLFLKMASVVMALVLLVYCSCASGLLSMTHVLQVARL